MKDVSWHLIFTIILVTFGGSFQFFNISVINQSQVIIEKWIATALTNRYGAIVDDATVTLIYSLTTSSVSLGAVFGCFLTRLLADKCGRKRALLINGFVGITGAILAGMLFLYFFFHYFYIYFCFV